MKGKWYTLGAGIALLILGMLWTNWATVMFVTVGGLYMFLAGVLFERYSPEASFTGVTTVKDLPTGDMRGEPPIARDDNWTRRFELNLVDMLEMEYPIPEIAEKLEEAGFDMRGEIVWWDDLENNKRIFTQKKETT